MKHSVPMRAITAGGDLLLAALNRPIDANGANAEQIGLRLILLREVA
jgi:hypothetical protein